MSLCQCPTGMQRAHMRQLAHTVSMNCGHEHLWIHGLTHCLTPETLGVCVWDMAIKKACGF